MSVIIPTRNRRKRLARCVGSALGSSTAPLEVVVVDDASDYDLSADFVGTSLVRVIRNPSRRLLSYARNVGAQAARGDLLFFLDDDNLVAPGAIGELAKVVELDDRVGVSSALRRLVVGVA